MDYLGEANLRKIYYLSIIKESDLASCNFLNKNWLALVFSDDNGQKNINLLKNIAKKCLQNNVLWICASGKIDKLIHDTFDQEIMDNQDNPNVDKDICTTWNRNFAEEFWFSVTAAFHPYQDINSVVCIDVGLNKKDEIKKLINNINSGWLPE